MSLLKDLFYGELNVSCLPFHFNPEYLEARKGANDALKKLQRAHPDLTDSELDELDSAYAPTMGVIAEMSFIRGVQFGARFLFEATQPIRFKNHPF